MFKFLLKRILSLLPVIIMISITLFFIMKSMPGDPVMFAMPPVDNISPAEYRELYALTAARLGLDRSLIEQYFIWAFNLLRGDFGYSLTRRLPVRDILLEPLLNSIFINFFSIIVAFLIAIPVGIKSAVKRNSVYDRGWQVFSIFGLSMPTFFIGLTLIYIFAIRLRLLPYGGMPFENPGSLEYYLSFGRFMILPIVTLTIGGLAGTIRYVRNAMLEAISKDYIRTARAKGLQEKVVIYHHAFRNALIPIVTIVSFSIVGLFGGSAITESIFVWNGIGTVLIRSLTTLDFNVVLVLNMFYAVLALVANIVMDIGYALVDPRIRLG
jgi:peptide/nickel transport system permease protein